MHAFHAGFHNLLEQAAHECRENTDVIPHPPLLWMV
jgi:hypothetical protein